VESLGQANPVAAVRRKRIEARRASFRILRRPVVMAGVFVRRMVPHSGQGVGSARLRPARSNLHLRQCGFGEMSLPRMAMRRRKRPINAETIENTRMVKRFVVIMGAYCTLIFI